MFNQAIMIGHLGTDPELRETNTTGTSVTSFQLAVNERFYDRRNRPQERTYWFKVRCWDILAETVSEYMYTGRRVAVIGKVVDPEAWEGDNGDLNAQAVIEARNVIFLDRREDGDEEDDRPRRDSRRNGARETQRRRENVRNAGQNVRRSVRRAEPVQENDEEEAPRNNRRNGNSRRTTGQANNRQNGTGQRRTNGTRRVPDRSRNRNRTAVGEGSEMDAMARLAVGMYEPDDYEPGHEYGGDEERPTTGYGTPFSR